MNRIGPRLLGLLAALVAGAWAQTAQAQATRTWVSGVGDDANPCSRTAPCKTFAGAISKTAAAGEINVLDPGGFGAVTITKSITIDGGGFLAGVLVSGTNGIVVSAGATDRVVLRGLLIDGLNTGLSGIRFLAGGALHVENCNIFEFTGVGIDFEPNQATASQVFVSHTRIFANASHGILVKPAGGGTAVATVEDCIIKNNTLTGVRGEDNATVSIRRTSAASNGNGFVATATSLASVMNIDDSQATGNSSSGVAAGFGTAAATIRLGNSMITGNTFGLRLGAGGTLITWGDNHVAGNGTDGLPTSVMGKI